MSTKVCCKFDEVIWKCEADNWKDQNDRCFLAIKSKHRDSCMYMCDAGRCDNPYAHAKAKEKGAT